MADELRAMILGAGFAAQGHTAALKEAGVQVVAMASRTEEVCRQVADSLEIPTCGND